MSRNWFHAFCAFLCLFALMRLFPLFPCLHKIEGTLPEQPSTLSNSQMLMACFEIVQNKPRMEYGRGETLLTRGEDRLAMFAPSTWLFAVSVAAGPQRRSLQLLGWIDVEQESFEMSLYFVV